MIEIVENVLPYDQLVQAQKKFGEPNWGFGFISTEYNKPIWNYNRYECVGVINNLMENERLKQFTLLDYHVNGQTTLLDGSMHRDSAGGITHAFVYFPYEWQYQWGGRLHITTPNGMEVITPKVNTGVLFDASYEHYAEGPSSRATSKLRVSVGLKLLLPTT